MATSTAGKVLVTTTSVDLVRRDRPPTALRRCGADLRSAAAISLARSRRHVRHCQSRHRAAPTSADGDALPAGDAVAPVREEGRVLDGAAAGEAIDADVDAELDAAGPQPGPHVDAGLAVGVPSTSAADATAAEVRARTSCARSAAPGSRGRRPRARGSRPRTSVPWSRIGARPRRRPRRRPGRATRSARRRPSGRRSPISARGTQSAPSARSARSGLLRDEGVDAGDSARRRRRPRRRRHAPASMTPGLSAASAERRGQPRRLAATAAGVVTDIAGEVQRVVRRRR